MCSCDIQVKYFILLCPAPNRSQVEADRAGNLKIKLRRRTAAPAPTKNRSGTRRGWRSRATPASWAPGASW
ncbi:unnamed protein product [Callosobruchus maculatus]|uniref:Uncharacterized protein n=1 Tax=Callosobruchus maculatus TaxID=64391 RepID=A0A653DIV9_CALMS|nr:unnamed protein product [Callosobruchus maculatus]